MRAAPIASRSSAGGHEPFSCHRHCHCHDHHQRRRRQKSHSLAGFNNNNGLQAVAATAATDSCRLVPARAKCVSQRRANGTSDLHSALATALEAAVAAAAAAAAVARNSRPIKAANEQLAHSLYVVQMLPITGAFPLASLKRKIGRPTILQPNKATFFSAPPRRTQKGPPVGSVIPELLQ